MEDWINSGVDGVVLKTCTYKPRKGYKSPNVSIYGDSVVQAMGLPNPGYKKTAERAKKIKKKYPGTFVIASFTTGSEKEIKEIVGELSLCSDALEYNVSCPHAKGLGSSIGYDMEFLEKMVHLAKKSTEKPLGLKMPYFSTENMLNGFIKSSKKADFYTCLNSIGKAMMIGENFGISNKIGGLSGPSIRPLSVCQTYRIRTKTDKFVFGCGGITRREDVAEYVKAGANAVQLGSGVLRYRKKKDFVEEIRKGFTHRLKDYFRKEGKEVYE